MDRRARIKINPAVLTWAREWFNMSTGDLANKMNVPLERIEAWESGKQQPTLSQLKKLSAILEKPLEIFMYPVVPTLPQPMALYRAVYGDYSAEIPTEILKIISHAKQFQAKLRELTNGQNPSKNLITKETFTGGVMDVVTQVRHFLNKMDISLQKQKERQTYAEAFDYWRNLFAEVGIFVIKDSFKDPTYSGFCLDDPEYPVICVNNSMNHQRQIFTLFHELYHLLKKQNGVDITHDDEEILPHLSSEMRTLERECDQFAAEFLVPTDDFQAELNKISDLQDILKYGDNDTVKKDCIIPLSRLYCVSQDVILRKLVDTQKMSIERYHELRPQYRSSVLRNPNTKSGGNYYATRVAYLGRPYIQLVLEKQERYGFEDYVAADFLNIKTENLHHLVMAATRGDV